MEFFFVRKVVEFGSFQASELELDDTIAILTRISYAEQLNSQILHVLTAST